MTSLISYPFRLDGRGYVATRDDGSDAYYAEEIAGLVQTEPGEREMALDYGIEDPLFRTKFPTDELVAKNAKYGPPVVIDQVQTQHKARAVMNVKVNFRTRLDSEQN